MTTASRGLGCQKTHAHPKPAAYPFAGRWHPESPGLNLSGRLGPGGSFAAPHSAYTNLTQRVFSCTLSMRT
jgi:hypothetical protein